MKSSGKLPIFTNLKRLKYLFVFLGVALIAFDISYYMMSVLPGTRDSMCMMGANLTPVNLAFAGLLSLLTGVLFAGFIQLFFVKLAKQKAMMSSLSGMGFLAGSLSVICPACTLPVISLFGITVWTDFISDHDVLLKLVSLAMMAGSLYLLNSQLKNTCVFCAADNCDA